MLDFKKQAAQAAARGDDGIDVHITNIDGSLAYYEKDGEQRPVTIRIAGSHSRTYRRIEHQQRDRKIKPRTFKVQSALDDAMERVVACTLGWEGFGVDGTPVPFTRDNARVLYQTCDWIYDEVVEAMHDTKLFFSDSSTTPQNASEQRAG